MAHQQDPVCGQSIDGKAAESRDLYTDFDGERFWFCGRDCKQRFDQRPTAYTLAEEEWRASTEGMSEPYPIRPSTD